MEETPQNQVPVEAPPQRSGVLSVLCILTFIWSGMGLFSSLIFSLFYDPMVEMLKKFVEMAKFPGMETILDAPQSYYIAYSFCFAGSIAGAAWMWRLRRLGFHIYTISQILLIISQMYFLKLPGPSVLDVIISAIFIVLYSRHLKIMH